MWWLRRWRCCGGGRRAKSRPSGLGWWEPAVQLCDTPAKLPPPQPGAPTAHTLQQLCGRKHTDTPDGAATEPVGGMDDDDRTDRNPPTRILHSRRNLVPLTQNTIHQHITVLTRHLEPWPPQTPDRPADDDRATEPFAVNHRHPRRPHQQMIKISPTSPPPVMQHNPAVRQLPQKLRGGLLAHSARHPPARSI